MSLQFKVSEMSVNGAIVICNASEQTDLSKLKPALDAIGLGGTVPDARSFYAVLRSALTEYFGRGHLIQPLKSRVGYDVKQVERSDEGVDNPPVAVVKVDDMGQIYCSDYHVQTGVQLVFDTLKGLIGRSDVGNCVTKIVGHLNGVGLKDSGGVYWVPADQLATVRQAAGALESAAVKGDTRFHVVETRKDSDCIKAVADGARMEAQQAIASMSKALADNAAADADDRMGKRAIRTKKRTAKAIRDKIREYESICGVAMSDLQNALADVETEIATAELLASAEASDSVNSAQPMLAFVR